MQLLFSRQKTSSIYLIKNREEEEAVIKTTTRNWFVLKLDIHSFLYPVKWVQKDFRMSWLNSLNNIKGQISNLAQEVLAETRSDFEDSPSTSFEVKLRELEELCLSKDGEVSFGLQILCFQYRLLSFQINLLKKQILEIENAKVVSFVFLRKLVIQSWFASWVAFARLLIAFHQLTRSCYAWNSEASRVAQQLWKPPRLRKINKGLSFTCLITVAVYASSSGNCITYLLILWKSLCGNDSFLCDQFITAFKTFARNVSLSLWLQLPA